MWRLQCFFNRALHRCQASAPLRLTQSHCVEDEVINGSTLLSSSLNSSDSSSQRGQDGGKRSKQKTSRFFFTQLPRYTALDAVGWGAAAILFMQVCRRVHSRLSAGGEARPGSAGAGPLAPPFPLHKCGYRVLLEILSTSGVSPRAGPVMCLHMLPERHAQSQSQSQSQSHNTTTTTTSSSTSASSSSDTEGVDPFSIDSLHSDHRRADLSQDSSPQGAPSVSTSSSHLEDRHHAVCPSPELLGDDSKQEEGAEQRLAEAASSLRLAGDASVPVILNIIGLESASSRCYPAAFSCFVAAARLGYGKAQFNAGVCLETGRGVARDPEKALHYYSQAAAGGHVQAQYRYAKLLLTSRGRPSPQAWSAAVRLLEQAAAAGLAEAQVLLGSVFSQEEDQVTAGHQEVAAERASGAQQNPTLSAARAEPRQLKNLWRLRPDDEAALRSIRSVPCFSGASPLLPRQQHQLPSPAPHPRPHLLAAGLTHSWSTGSLASAPPTSLHLHLLPQGGGAGGGACRWTLGL